MSEAENVEVYDYPVRYIEIAQGIDEEGGGVRITVRLDDVDPEKVMEIALRVYHGINGKSKQKRSENVEVA